ncbi:thioredoxin domain-containing protein [Streptomyces sp. UNOC14_S4]|nr:thioredoxin domain-containing protein [Streptomyces sp. UNOC14_S4]
MDNRLWITRRRRRDVPVFLGVGYSSCHWCQCAYRIRNRLYQA